MSESIFKANEANKTSSFKQNKNLNDLISELSNLLKPVQGAKQKEFLNSQWPVGFIIGNPRSGTTLVLQWLASLDLFSYPTNVLNRFAYAPYIGALVQNVLFNSKFDFHDEFNDLKNSNNFESSLGKTKGALSPSEFQHFFRNYMPNFDPEFLDDHKLARVDFQGIKNGLASIESVFEKPFVLKSVMLQYNLKELYKTIPNSIYIYIKRDPIYNMQSLLLARENYYGDRNIWWSVKPKEYEFLKDLDVFHQIAGQVYFSNLGIERGLKAIPGKNKLFIDYESFCKDPEIVFYELIRKYKQNNFKIIDEYKGKRSFVLSNDLKLNNKEIDKLNRAFKFFKNKS